MNKKIIVKKIWSLNPTKYKKITLEEASRRYFKYMSYFICKQDYMYKSFTEWLESEI
jgi:hypothetical protein